ncbi:MAG: hypothetical protein WCQ47_00980 [bacterium]
MNKFIIFLMFLIISPLGTLRASDDILDTSIREDLFSNTEMDMMEIRNSYDNFSTATDELLREKLWDNDKKAMISLLTDQSDDGGLTLLMIASAFGDLDTVKNIINSDTKVEDQILVKIKGINKEKDKNFYDTTFHFVNKQKEEGTYIRAVSNHGYSALTYAVIGGHYDIVVYIIETLKKKLAPDAVAAFINKDDNYKWNSVLYSVAYKPIFDSQFEQRELNHTKILGSLIANGGKTKVAGKNLYEGDLDIISLCAKYAHLNIIKYLRSYYQALKNQKNYPLINELFGSNQELETKITRATKVALSNKDKTKISATEKSKYIDIITELAAWSQDLCFKLAYSHYRLAAYSHHKNDVSDYFGAYNFMLSYTYDGNNAIDDVKIKYDDVVKTGVRNEEKFKYTYLVRYLNTRLSEAQKIEFGNSNDYQPKNFQEAYVIIKWSYKNTSRPIKETFGGPEEGTYTDTDYGLSVIRIDTSNGNPTSDVIKDGGTWLIDSKNSGLTKF